MVSPIFKEWWFTWQDENRDNCDSFHSYVNVSGGSPYMLVI